MPNQEPVSLVRFKLYPYVLFGCAVVGSFPLIHLHSLFSRQKLFFFWKHRKGSIGKILWTVTVTDLAAQTQYVIDGVEEAVGELIVGVKATTVFKEACNEGSRKGFIQNHNELYRFIFDLPLSERIR